MQKKYCWSLDQYDTLNQIAVALTNYHVARHPLCEEDCHFFVHVNYQLAEIAESVSKKRKATQAKYWLNWKTKLGQQMYVADSIEDSNIA